MKRKSFSTKKITAGILAAAMTAVFALSGCGGSAPAPAAGDESARAQTAADDSSKAQTAEADTKADSGEQTGTEPQQETKKVTMLLDWTPNTNHTGIYVARELGYYADAGLDVSIELPYDGTATQLLGVGKGDFCISNSEDIINALTLDDPMPVTSVAAIIQHNTSGFVSLAGKGIESPADWTGKTYGGYGGTIEEQVVRTVAEKNGADPDSIRFVTLGNSDIMTALNTDIDFAWVFEGAELVNLNLQNAATVFFPIRDFGKEFDYYTPVLAANTDIAAADPEMVRAFVTATAKGYEYAIENPDKAAEILLKAEPELDEALITQSQFELSEKYAQDVDQWGIQKEEVWKNYADFLYQHKLIGKEADVSALFTNEYLPQK